MFDAVIFDFDGVILDSEPIHYTACCEALAKLDLTLTFAEYQQHYIGLADKEMFPRLLQNKGYQLSTSEIISLIQQKIRIYTHLIETNSSLPIVQGVDQFIVSLVEQEKKIAICSGSTREEIIAVLKKLNHGALLPYFTTIVSAEDVNYGKPSPEGYLLSARQLAVSPEQCLVFEDTPHGIQAAKGAGMSVIGLLTTHPHHVLQGADRIITHFRELTFDKVSATT